MIKLCKWGCGCHMHILKLNPLYCSGIAHSAFNSGILRCRKLIMNIFSKPKTLITFQANIQMTIVIHYQIFRNYSYKSKLHSQNSQVDYIWERSIITQF